MVRDTFYHIVSVLTSAQSTLQFTNFSQNTQHHPGQQTQTTRTRKDPPTTPMPNTHPPLRQLAPAPTPLLQPPQQRIIPLLPMPTPPSTNENEQQSSSSRTVPRI